MTLEGLINSELLPVLQEASMLPSHSGISPGIPLYVDVLEGRGPTYCADSFSKDSFSPPAHGVIIFSASAGVKSNELSCSVAGFRFTAAVIRRRILLLPVSHCRQRFN